MIYKKEEEWCRYKAEAELVIYKRHKVDPKLVIYKEEEWHHHKVEAGIVIN